MTTSTPEMDSISGLCKVLVIAEVIACRSRPSIWYKVEGLISSSGSLCGAFRGSLDLKLVVLEEPAFAIAQGRRVVQTSPK